MAGRTSLPFSKCCALRVEARNFVEPFGHLQVALLSFGAQLARRRAHGKIFHVLERFTAFARPHFDDFFFLERAQVQLLRRVGDASCCENVFHALQAALTGFRDAIFRLGRKREHCQ